MTELEEIAKMIAQAVLQVTPFQDQLVFKPVETQTPTTLGKLVMTELALPAILYAQDVRASTS